MGLPRRDFLARLAGGVAAASITPTVALRAAERARPLRTLALVGDDEAYWKTVRDQFPIKQGFIFLNAANLAPSPYVVSDSVADLTRESAITRNSVKIMRRKFLAFRNIALKLIAAVRLQAMT